MKFILLRAPLFIITFIMVNMLLDRYAFHAQKDIKQIVATALLSYVFFELLLHFVQRRRKKV